MAIYIFICIVFLSSVALLGLIALKNGPKAYLSDSDFFSKNQTEVIRGIIAIGIVISHISSSLKGLPDLSGVERVLVRFCLPFGAVGVDIFFFCSGYGNVISIHRANNKKKWLLKRCLSILAVYISCYLLQLIALIACGYETSFSKEIYNIVRLRMPRTSAWYIKVQMAMYVFLLFTELFRDKKYKVIVMFLMCSMLSVILYFIGYAEHGWMSNLCFPIGMGIALYKNEVITFLNNKRNICLICSSVLILPIYLCTFLSDHFLIKLIGNALVVSMLLLLLEYVTIRSRIYSVLGKYSLHIYLLHSGLISWIIERELTNGNMVYSLILVTVLTYAGKIISDRVIKVQNKVFSYSNR